jgi:hypothetical protein
LARSKYKPGQIVWARVPDRNEIIKGEPRPILVLLTHPSDKRAPLWGIAISTRKDIDPKDPTIEMPWNAETGDTTGLFEWCAAVLLWFVQVPQETIERISGCVNEEFFAMVQQRVAEARSEQAKRVRR